MLFCLIMRVKLMIKLNKKGNIMNVRKIFLALSLIAVTLAQTGCSVGMALSGKKDPDLSVLKVGANRSEVELQLGAPIKVAGGENNSTVAVYEYEIGNQPSAGRAVAHGAMDVLTLGLWEVIGTPVEASNGDKFNISITFDKDDKVASFGRPVK